MKRNLRALCTTVLVLQACVNGHVDNVGTPPAGAGNGGFSSGVQGTVPSGGGTGGTTPVAPPTVVGGSGPLIPVAGGSSGMPVIPVVPTETMGSGPDPDNWAGFGGGLEQAFARTNAMIDSTNWGMVGMAWDKPAGGGITGTPAIYNGVVYWADWIGNVHAAKFDGTTVWDKKFPRGFSSSPFVDDKRVYLADRDNLVKALDRATGDELWSTPLTDVMLAQLWSSPTVADGIVVVGLGCKGTSNGSVPYSPADLMKFRGGVVGLNAETGKIIWKFDNTKSTMFGAGVSSWSSAALDTKRKIAYIGTGNSYYSPASPYSDSLLALKYDTTKPEGELVWSMQFTMNDNFTSGSPNPGPDSDVGATPNIFTLDGKDYVAVGDKGGNFYVLDRETGMLAYPKINIGPGSSNGGVMAPAAYADGVLYVTCNSRGSSVIKAIEAKTGKVLWTTTEPSGAPYGAPLLLKDILLVGPTAPFPSGNRPGQILAFKRDSGMKLPMGLGIKNQHGGGIAIYKSMLFIPYGFVFENTGAESTLMGGMLAAAIGGTPVSTVDPMDTPATYAPTFSAIYKEILNDSKIGCTTSFCHGSTGLQIDVPTTAYTNLMTMMPKADGCTGMTFVKPGMPMQSLLYQKLLAAPPCGKQMPAGGNPLTDMQMGQIRMWIEAGAQNN